MDLGQINRLLLRAILMVASTPILPAMDVLANSRVRVVAKEAGA